MKPRPCPTCHSTRTCASVQVPTIWQCLNRSCEAAFFDAQGVMATADAHTLEVVARAAGQPVSRAHLFTFNVPSHEEPLATLQPDSDVVVEAVFALVTTWAPVRSKHV